MENDNSKFKRNSRVHLFLGIVLVLLGLAVIAEMFDAVPWRMRDIIFSWQMILIVLGVIFISGSDSRSTGYILLGIGVFFILPRFFDVPHYWRSLFWPMLLIILGLLILFGRFRRPHASHQKSASDDVLDDVDIFGGSERILHSQNFKGGKISNIFGGSKYDMRQAKLAEGVNVLQVSMIFGGSKFVVPEEWDVRLEVTSVFGGFADKRHRSIVVPDSSRKLIIKGEAVFGGGELTNF